MQTEKLLLPRWIIPLEGDTEVLENYGLAIENGRIAARVWQNLVNKKLSTL